MARNYYLNGETMLAVKGRSDSAIGTLTNLGLTDEAVKLTVDYKHLHIHVDAYGESAPEIQSMGGSANVQATLVHFDPDVLMACVREGMGAAPAEGQLGHAGTLMGNGTARFTAGINGNHFVGLNIISATGKQPWRFLYTVMADQPLEFPLGTARSLVSTRWHAVPYSADPWNNGTGSYGVPIWDHTSDS